MLVAARLLSAVVTMWGISHASEGNNPPNAPTITEPRLEGQEVSYGDVHMECMPFSDPNPDDVHRCSDWEIWQASPPELAWATYCIGGAERVHTHLRDGVFMNSYAGRAALLPETAYVLRTRHKDSSGDPGSEWSAWSQRGFVTTSAAVIPPLEMDDVADDVAPRWTDSAGQEIYLPTAPPLPAGPALIRVESQTGQALLELRSRDGQSNTVVNAAALAEHAAVRMRVSAGGLPSPLTLPPTTLTFNDHDGEVHTVYMPALMVPPGSGNDVFLWVSAGGATYYGEAGQTTPDFSRLARSQALPWAVRQPGYRVDLAATGFQLPVNIAFIPDAGNGADDPYYYVTELFGTVKVVTRSGTVSDYATNLLNYTAYTAFGLTGIVIEPTTGDVFVSMVYEQSGVPGLFVPRIVRLHSTDGGRTAASETVVFYAPGENQGSSHQISAMAIIDGTLFVNSADGFYTDLAQNLDFYRGKILRMNLDGSAVTSNPFYNAADGISARDYVYALGFRNPFGGAWRASDNMYYIVENGPATDRFARIDRGRNYLWDGTEESMHEGAIYNWFHAHAPTNIAFVQPQTFGGSLFPAGTMDHAYVAESGPTGLVGPQFLGKRISEFVVGPNAELIRGPRPLVEYDGAGVATIVALAAGPDGLYFSDFFKDSLTADQFPVERGSNILRVKYVGEAEFTTDVRTGSLPLTVHFSDLSTVVNPTAWEWSFGDGTISTEQNPSHTYTQAGVYDVRMAVNGAGGLLVEHKACFVRAGTQTRIAMLGAATLGAGDQAVVSHLLGRGDVVQVFDAASGSRPSASQIAMTFDLALLAPSSVGASVGQEFAAAAIPVISWDPATLGIGRLGLSESATTYGFQTSINVTNNRHPITLGLPLGQVTVFDSFGTMSFVSGNLAPEARYLATRVGAQGDQSISLADVDTPLLGGGVAPARRAFLFFGSGFNHANANGQRVLDQAVDWVAQIIQPAIVSQPESQMRPAGATVMLAVQARGSGPLSYQWYRSGAALADGARISGSHAAELSIQHVELGDVGDYHVIVSNSCSSATSNTVAITIGCSCDWNASGTLNSQDFFDFISAFFLTNADFNNDGLTNSQDFFDFIGCFFGGC